MDLETVDQAAETFLAEQPEGEPPAFAQYLVQQKLLTPFQADRLLQGKSQDLVLGPYTLLEAVGTGSMGTVYRAVSSKDHKPYAVKVLPRRSMWNARMARRQVTTFEKCKHPAVVPFVDVGTAGAMHYLAWPFVEGESLQSLVQRTGRLEPKQAADYALQVAEGLAICHQNGLIHGMLKPSNLLVGPDQKIRILDYGVGALLAQGDSESLIDTRSTANVLAAGLDCVSPECILEPSKQSSAGDQYSLGCVLYFCLAGRLPFEGSASEKLQAHQTQQPDPIQTVNPDVPEALAKIVNRLMQKEPAGRYFDMNQVIAALSSVVKPVVDSTTTETNVMPDPSAPTSNETQPIPADNNATPPIPQPNPETVGAIPIQAASTSSETQVIPVNRESASIIPPPSAESPCVAFSLPTSAPCDLSMDSPVSESKRLEPLPDLFATQIDSPPPPKESGVTVLPPGTTQVLGKVTRRAASEFSVFDMPPLDFPPLPARAPEGSPQPVKPKLQPPASPEGLVSVKDEVVAVQKDEVVVGQKLEVVAVQKDEVVAIQKHEVVAAQPALPHSEPMGPQLSFEERLGKNGTLILTLIAGVVAFLLFLLFKP
jgi:serine/threonine-protein kinase